jgi:hypothetical protein
MGGAVKKRLCINWLWVLAVISNPSFALSISPATDYMISQTPVFDSASAVRIPLKIQTPSECNGIKAVLVQRATALAAILDERTIDDCALNDHDETQFSFTVPNVARLTQYTWEFHNCAAEQDCVSVGEVSFFALPENYLQPLINWSQEHTVFVSDADGWLAAFLDRLGVQYTQNTREVGADDDVVVLINVAQATDLNVSRDLPFGRSKRIIEFHDYASDQPMVWVDSSPAGVVIAVRFALIHTPERDPDNKKIFYELFQRLF